MFICLGSTFQHCLKGQADGVSKDLFGKSLQAQRSRMEEFSCGRLANEPTFAAAAETDEPEAGGSLQACPISGVS